MRNAIYYSVRFFCFVVITISINGCFDLDSSLFNNDKLTAYSLRTTVIPESSRTQIILTSQGKKIYGYYVASSNVSETNIILYNHGNRDHLQYYWDRVELFYKMGFNVFVYDYQGYGMSEGEPSEAGIYSDATTAYQFVKSLGYADSSITVYGFSLGGAPAVHLASSVFTPRRLILEAAFASATTLTQSGTLIDLPSSYFMKGEYRNDEKIKHVYAPVIILHGVQDTFIDLEKNGRVLFNNANEPKKFVPVNGANHSEIPAKMGEAAYLEMVRGFITQHQ